MSLAYNADDNIRFNGTGRAFAATVGAATYGKLIGYFDAGFGFNQGVTTTEVKDYSTAARGNILSITDETDPVLTIPALEQTEDNLKMTLMGSDWTDENQSASYMDSVSTAFTIDEYFGVGYVDVFITKLLHGTEAVSNFQIDEVVTGGTSSATGTIKWNVQDTYVELVNVSGTFVAGETITGGTSSTTATVSSVQELNDVVFCDADPGTARRVKDTHYKIDPQYGLIQVIHATPSTPEFISCDYPAINKQYMHGMATTTVERKIVFVTDKDDTGPRYKITFHKVSISLSGDIILVGDGSSVLTMQGKVLSDDSQSLNEKYYKVEKFAT